MRSLAARARSRLSRSSGPQTTSILLLGLVWAVSAAYVAGRLDQGWFPPDDGILAHSAERILHGETPHADFDDIYTGGLTYLHALGLRIFGTNLLSLRLVLFVFFLAWVPVVYWIATQFARPATAALTSLLAVAWSVPTYTAAMPSWYNLFLATFGTGALLKHVATGHGVWLLAAGFCAGLSMMVKIVGVHFVVGALLFLAFREQISPLRSNTAVAAPALVRYWMLVLGALLTLTIALLETLRYFPTLNAFTHFVLPTVAIGALLLRNEGAALAGPFWQRLGRLLRLAGPFLVGLLTP
ncbi:MAG: glycosyltransferase family 39 protein, partial [Gemmatimonadetes bacterium]|nr:glycosyltransferase family 39 protein [Gemmatimonadota bacterium]